GQELRWNVAQLGPSNPLPLLFIQHLTPLAERKRQVFRAGDHPNAVLRTDRVYIAVDDVAKAAETYGVVLGMPVPRLERGNVIKADMAVFNLGPTGLTVAQPAEPGPAADALARRGPGPFQVLHRTRSLDAAARWMADHGLPPPARGVRNTGEEAMLVGPAHTCGAHIGFGGPKARRMNEHNNGYMAMGRYAVWTSEVNANDKPDLNEAFFIKRERAADDPLLRSGRRFVGPNRWPDDLPGFREAVLAYTDAVDALGRRLLPVCAVALDLPPDYFDAAFAESQFSFRLSHYPPVTAAPNQFGIAPHTDANF